MSPEGRAGVEQIPAPDPEVCLVLGPVAGGRWIQTPHFCQIWGQLACQICRIKVSFAEKWGMLYY